MDRSVICSALLLAVALPATAKGEFIVTVANANIPMGGKGYADVFITSDSGDSLSSFGFEFLLTRISGAGQLAFVSPPTAPQLTQANYVFFGDSAAAGDGGFVPFPVGSVSTTNVPNDTFVGGDTTASFSGIVLNSTKLLARLELTTDSGLPPGVGDTFALTLVRDSAFVGFYDGSSELVPFNEVAGTITIVQGVPEPTSLSLLLIGTVASGLGLWRKMRSKISPRPALCGR